MLLGVTAVPGLPDLEERFLTGTTIALLAPAGDAVEMGQQFLLPIQQSKRRMSSSARLCGDLTQADFGARAGQQWIELYNTTTT